MDDERRNLLDRRHTLSAYSIALENPAAILHACGTVDGGTDAARRALMAQFGFTDIQAVAVLHLQIWRFTPEAVGRIREELDDMERRLAELEDS